MIVKNFPIQNKRKEMISDKDKNLDNFTYKSPLYLKYFKIIKKKEKESCKKKN